MLLDEPEELLLLPPEERELEPDDLLLDPDERALLPDEDDPLDELPLLTLEPPPDDLDDDRLVPLLDVW